MFEPKVERLSEGMDFIEEACGYSEPLEFVEVPEATIVESESSGSKFRILGKVSGVFAPIGEFSRNKRLYESDHWPHVLSNPDIQNRIKSRGMFGMISHEDKRIDDMDLKEGKVSHIITKLEVRENLENKPFLYGEFEILDTPAGRILKGLYEGGANLYVSSRGAGKLEPVPGQDYKRVCKDQYFLEGFDVVCRPGFLKAKPMFEGVKESEEVNEAEVSGKIVESTDSKKGVVNELDEISALKSQVERLAAVVEKVVDNFYEEPEEVPAKNKPLKENLDSFLQLMAETNVSDEVMQDVLEMIFNKEDK